MADPGVTPSTYNARIVALRFFFSMTCGREEMKRFMQFRREPGKLPIVLNIEEISALLAAAPGPGLKYCAALSIGYTGGLRASEVTHLKVRDIDSDRMLIHVERGKGGKDRDVMLSPSLLDLLRNYLRDARPQGWLFPGQSRVNPISSRQLNRAYTSAKLPLIAAGSARAAIPRASAVARNVLKCNFLLPYLKWQSPISLPTGDNLVLRFRIIKLFCEF
jgi:integrase